MERCCAILVNYFGAADTAAAALSVLADSPDTSVVVVDNSNDVAEAALLRSLLPRLTQILDSGGNLGFGGACNLGWRASSSQYVFFVNPDVRLLPKCTAGLLTALDTDLGLAAVAPRQYLDAACRWQLSPAWLPTALRFWAQEKALRDSRAWSRLARAARAERRRLAVADSPLAQRALSGGALMIRRSALDPGEAPFDPRFFMYFEDSDLCMRLRRRKQRLAVVPQACAVHAWQNLPHKGPLMEQAANEYFNKYALGTSGRWRDRAHALSAIPMLTEGLAAFAPWPAHGVPLPAAWRAGWVLELGLSPLLQTVVSRHGVGPVVEEPLDALSQLGEASVYGRLSPYRACSEEEALHFYWPAGVKAPSR